MKLNVFQKRLIIISLGILVVLVSSWSFAFKKTWVNYAEVQKMRSNLNNAELSQKTIAHLTKQLEGLQVNYKQTPDSSNAKIIFKKISDLSDKHKGLKIVRFPNVHTHQFKKYNIETLEIELEGDFENLLKFIHELETERNIGRIVSSSFDLHKDIRTKKEFLRLTVHIQNTQKMLTGNEDA